MKKVLPLLFLGSFLIVNAQSGIVTLDEQFNTSGISDMAPSYQPVIEPPRPKQNLFSDWGQSPAISPDITPKINDIIKDIRKIKSPQIEQEPDKVQEVIDEMFPNSNKIDVVTCKTPVSQTVMPVEQKPAIYENSKKQSSFDIDGLLNLLTIPLLIFGIVLFFIWFLSKNKVDVKFDVATTPKTKENYLSYSQRKEKLKETLIESAKQALVLDLMEMEIRGMLDDREIATQTLLRTYQEISLDQSNEYSKSANIPKNEVEKLINNVYQILKVQYYKSTI
ncbi:hypothetical protein HNP38_002300 [Chryseobacterium defluvii]|uniref:Oxygen tolerance protein BatD n=1 Tax=Chryseobacterium defluvii TaxID=160396 RepID=A0A840KH29_9FLAO|nr:hypothetical protein [Chryseobacterium defluvii]MBB4807004.1 hypothetical protein [Chryseobacterium defluvii]